jgi:hypothetical protein
MVGRRRQPKSDDDMGKVMHDLDVTGPLTGGAGRLISGSGAPSAPAGW